MVRLEASHDKLKALWLASHSLKQQWIFTTPPLSCTSTVCVAAIQRETPRVFAKLAQRYQYYSLLGFSALF